MRLAEAAPIPRHSNKQGINPTTNRSKDDTADLQADQEGKGEDDGGEGAVGVVGRVGELEVEVGEEGAEVGCRCRGHGEDGGR